MTMDVAVIKQASGKDCDEIWNMINELAKYEKMETSVEIDAERLRTDLEKGKFDCLICKLKDDIIGFAIFVYTFDIKSGKKMYLEDLFVKEKYRRQGVGHKLWSALTNKCKEKGCSTMEFSVLNWNKDAIKFYLRHGCQDYTQAKDKQVFRFVTGNL